MKGEEERGFLGEPFFVAKEWFPQAPSKKAALDFTGFHGINLRASERNFLKASFLKTLYNSEFRIPNSELKKDFLFRKSFLWHWETS